MLEILEGRTCYVATCDKCGVTADTDETDFDAAFFDMKRAEWLDMPRAGVEKNRWQWACPKCKPKGGGLGPSTGSHP